ncbi:MAG: hypothetical protein MUF53_09745, partial [Gemmatimonadaceae bacterium]|nr:hypothetical protein [Gemmatimonadaceae bacterium]
HLTGSAFADTLIGDAQANIIFGLDGDDSISGEAGNDLLDGGTGTNRLLEARDADFTLSDAQLLIGAAETDTLFNFASADLTGGVGANRLDASLFTGTGGVFLDGGGGNDTLIGSGRNDLLTGGAGADAIDGGGGLDTIVEDVDLDTVLTNGTLAIGGVLDTLTGVEQASIVGGDRGNLLDASTFSLGAVTLIGGEGNDRLLGGGGNDWLAPLGGLDSVAGGAGTDRLVAQGLRRGVLTDTGFDKGAGTLAIWTLSVSGSGRFTVGDGTDVTTSIAVGALASEVALALTRLRSLGEGNVAVASVTGGYLVAIGGALAGQAGPDLSLAAASGAPVLGAARTTAAVTRQDTISGIERAELRGTALADVLDARGFTGGPVTLLGSAGSDTLYGGSGADSIVAGGGDDEVDGGGGADTLLGGEGVDRLLATGAGDVVLNNTTLTRTIAGVVTTVSLTGFEAATLVGDGGANRLDARGFNGISLDTPVALLSPDGIFPAEPEVDDGPVPGGPTDPIPTRPDLVVTVTIGSDVRRYEVQLSGSAVVEDLVDSFNALAEPLTGTTTPDFVASFDAANGRIVLAAATGATLSVQAISAAAPLIGFTGTRSGATLQGEAMRGAGVRLEGLVGNDTLLGSGGDDTLAGGGGTNSLDGGAGTDTVLHETAPGDVTLEPTRLRVRAIGSATVLEDSALLGIERAILRGSGATGGATLNAGAFTGDVIFRDLGDDTVTGGGGTNRYALRAANNQPIAQPTIDVAAGGQSLFQIFVPSDVTLTQAMVNDGLALMPAPLNFPPLLPGTPPIITSQLEFYGTSITVSEALQLDGHSLLLSAQRVTITTGGSIDTSTTGAGGTVTINARRVVMEGNAFIDARGTGAAQHGAVLITASDGAEVGNFEDSGSFGFAVGDFANIQFTEAQVELRGGRIDGGLVQVTATADTSAAGGDPPIAPDGTAPLNWDAISSQLAEAAFSVISSFSLIFGINISRAVSGVTISDGFTASGTFVDVTATSLGAGSVAPIGIKGVGIGAVGISSEAVVRVEGDLEATLDVNLSALVTNTADIAVSVTGDLSAPNRGRDNLAREDDNKGVTVGIGVGVVLSSARVEVTETADITAGRDLDIQARTTQQTRLMIRTPTGPDGKFSLATGGMVEDKETLARLDGRADV